MKPSLKILPEISGVYGFLTFICFVLFAGRKALVDGDTLWHIKFGSLMIERGELITHDFYSHTAAGKPWTSHEWLSEIVMAAFHRVAGLPGVVIFYFFVAALSFWILFKVAKLCGAGDWLSIFAVSLALLLALNHLLARPHIFTWLFGMTTLYILLRGGRLLFFLPLLAVPWANLHGGVVLGLVVQALFLAGRTLDQWFAAVPRPGWRAIWEEQKIPCVVLLLSLAAAGINPFGYRLLLFPFEVDKGVFSTVINEWMSPNLQEYWPFRLYLLFLFSLLFFSGPGINWVNRLLLIFFVNASLIHFRHVSIAGLFLTPLVIQGVKPILELPLLGRRRSPHHEELSLSRAAGPLATTAVFLLLILLSALRWAPWERLSAILVPPPGKASSHVVEYLKKNRPAGNLFNSDEWGDFLIYAMEPPPKLFLDGRLDMYGVRVLEDYARIVYVDEKVDALLDSYHIAWVLFPHSALTRYLKAQGEWREVFGDDQVLVLVRKTPPGP